MLRIAALEHRVGTPSRSAAAHPSQGRTAGRTTATAQRRQHPPISPGGGRLSNVNFALLPMPSVANTPDMGNHTPRTATLQTLPISFHVKPANAKNQGAPRPQPNYAMKSLSRGSKHHIPKIQS